MGTLFRIFVSLFGIKIRQAPAHFSEVSKTFEYLPGPKRFRWVWGGMLHIGPVVAVLIVLFFYKSDTMLWNPANFVALVLACSWLFLGPVLIWYFEKIALPSFNAAYRDLITDKEQYRQLRGLSYTNIYRLNPCIFLTVGWMAITLAAFVSSTRFLSGLGIGGDQDIFYWFISVGVVLASYYTSIGFCLAYKAIYLVWRLATAPIKVRLYSVDSTFGLSFVGKFALQTAWMFFSGWLFAPLIILTSLREGLDTYFIGTGALGIYFVVTTIVFFLPIYFMHVRILKEKASLAKKYEMSANRGIRRLEGKVTDELVKRMEFDKAIITELRNTPNWPLNVDISARFILTALVVPIVAAAITAALRHSP